MASKIGGIGSQPAPVPAGQPVRRSPDVALATPWAWGGR